MNSISRSTYIRLVLQARAGRPTNTMTMVIPATIPVGSKLQLCFMAGLVRVDLGVVVFSLVWGGVDLCLCSTLVGSDATSFMTAGLRLAKCTFLKVSLSIIIAVGDEGISVRICVGDVCFLVRIVAGVASFSVRNVFRDVGFSVRIVGGDADFSVRIVGGDADFSVRIVGGDSYFSVRIVVGDVYFSVKIVVGGVDFSVRIVV